MTEETEFPSETRIGDLTSRVEDVNALMDWWMIKTRWNRYWVYRVGGHAVVRNEIWVAMIRNLGSRAVPVKWTTYVLNTIRWQLLRLRREYRSRWIPVDADADVYSVIDEPGSCDVEVAEMCEDVCGSLRRNLKHRDCQILEMRFGLPVLDYQSLGILETGHPRSLEEVGKVFKITRERVRQISDRAINRLRLLGNERKIPLRSHIEWTLLEEENNLSLQEEAADNGNGEPDAGQEDLDVGRRQCPVRKAERNEEVQ